MFRSILGFAVLAVVAWLALKIFFGLLSGFMGLLVTLLWLAAIGFVVYLVLRVLSPSTANRRIHSRPVARRHSIRWLSEGFLRFPFWSFSVFCSTAPSGFVN